MDDPHGLFDEPPQPRTHGGDFDLFGKLRKVPLRLNRLKNTYSSTVKPDELNQDYLITEAPVATAVRTQSTVMKNFEQPYLTAFPDVEIAPANFHFGKLQVGLTYVFKAQIKNCGNTTARFKVIEPDKTEVANIEVRYRIGPVAPGIALPLTIELTPCTMGQHEIPFAVKSEKHIFHCPMTMEVLPDHVIDEMGGPNAALPRSGRVVLKPHKPNVVDKDDIQTPTMERDWNYDPEAKENPQSPTGFEPIPDVDEKEAEVANKIAEEKMLKMINKEA